MFGIVLGLGSRTKFIRQFVSKPHTSDSGESIIKVSRSVRLEDGLREDLTLSKCPQCLVGKDICIYYVLLDLSEEKEQIEEKLENHLKQLKTNENQDALQVFIGLYNGLNEYSEEKGSSFLELMMNKIGILSKNQRTYILDIKNYDALEDVLKETVTSALALAPGKEWGTSALREKTIPLIANFKSFINNKIREIDTSKQGNNFFKNLGTNEKILFLEDIKDYVEYPIRESLLSTFFDRHPAESALDFEKKVAMIDALYKEFEDRFFWPSMPRLTGFRR